MTTISFTPINGAPPTVTGGATQPGGGISFTPITGDQPLVNGGSTGNTTPTGVPQAPAGGATGNEEPLAAAGNVLKNFIPSALNFAEGAVKAPLEGLAGLPQIPGQFSALAKEQGGILPAYISMADQVAPSIYNSFVPKAAQDVVSAGGDVLKGGIGEGNTALTSDLTKASADLQNDPVGSVAPLLMVGRGVAEAVGPDVAAAFDRGVTKIASPVTATGDLAARATGATTGFLASHAGAALRFGVQQLTGLDANTIHQIASNPEAFSFDKVEATTREGVAQEVQDALNAREDAIEEGGKSYQPIRDSGQPVSVQPDDLQKQIQSTTGMTFDNGTWQRSTAGAVLSPADIGKINTFYKTWQPAFDSGEMTSNEFLNMRGELAKIANYEGGFGKSAPLEGAASRMRGGFNTAYRTQIPGLEDLDADQSAQRTEFKQLSKGLLDNEGNLRDSDINKIANATGKSRSVLLSQLEDLVPGITSKLNALKAAEDIRHTMDEHKVGTYFRGVGGGIAGLGVVTGHIPMIVAGITEAILTSPKVAVPMIRAYGYSRAIAAGVAANLASIARATNELPNGGEASFGKLTPRLQGAASAGAGAVRSYFDRNPAGVGLSLRDVSKHPTPDEKPVAYKLPSLTKLQDDLDADESATILTSKNGQRITIKDEGDHVRVGIDYGEGKLTSTDEKLPTRTFPDLKSAMPFIKELQDRAQAMMRAPKGSILDRMQTGNVKRIGAPTYYHGTNADFKEFNPGQNSEDFGTWFTPDRDSVSGYKNIHSGTISQHATNLVTEAQMDKILKRRDSADLPFQDAIRKNRIHGMRYDNGTIQLYYPNSHFLEDEGSPRRAPSSRPSK